MIIYVDIGHLNGFANIFFQSKSPKCIENQTMRWHLSQKDLKAMV